MRMMVSMELAWNASLGLHGIPLHAGQVGSGPASVIFAHYMPIMTLAQVICSRPAYHPWANGAYDAAGEWCCLLYFACCLMAGWCCLECRHAVAAAVSGTVCLLQLLLALTCIGRCKPVPEPVRPAGPAGLMALSHLVLSGPSVRDVSCLHGCCGLRQQGSRRHAGYRGTRKSSRIQGPVPAARPVSELPMWGLPDRSQL